MIALPPYSYRGYRICLPAALLDHTSMYALGPPQRTVNLGAHVRLWNTTFQRRGIRKGARKNRLSDYGRFLHFDDAETGENVLYGFAA